MKIRLVDTSRGCSMVFFYLVGGLFAGTIVSLFTSLPAAFVAVLAGLALLGAIAGNLFSRLRGA